MLRVLWKTLPILLLSCCVGGVPTAPSEVCLVMEGPVLIHRDSRLVESDALRILRLNERSNAVCHWK